MIRLLLTIMIVMISMIASVAEDQLPITLNIEGVFIDKKNPVAIIDGHIYEKGDTVEGAKIVEINNTHVKVDFDGVVYAVPVGVTEASSFGPPEPPGIKDKFVDWLASFGRKPGEQKKSKAPGKTPAAESQRAKTVEEPAKASPAPAAMVPVEPVIKEELVEATREQEKAKAEEAHKVKIEERRAAKEQARQEKIKQEQERQARLAEEKAKAQQAAFEKAERERLEQERIAKEKAERERLEKERIAKEKAERERLEQERIAKEKAANEQARKSSIAPELTQAEQESKEQTEQRAAQEQTAREQAERDRIAREQAAQEQMRQAKIAEEKARAEQAAREQAERDQIARQIAAIPAEDRAVIDQIFASSGKPNSVLFTEKFNEARRYFKEAEAAEKVSNSEAFESYSNTIQSITWAVRYGPRETGYESAERRQMLNMLQQALRRRREIAEAVLGNVPAASGAGETGSGEGKKGILKGLFRK